MYLKQHKVGEGNPKDSGDYCTKEDGRFFEAFYDGLSNKWYEYETLKKGEYGDEVFPDFWYSEVTERLYTEAEMLKSHSAGRENMYQAEFGSHIKAMKYSFEEFISQLNKDKDK